MKALKHAYYWLLDTVYMVRYRTTKWELEGVEIDPGYTSPGGRPALNGWKRKEK
jgi:hypothetical protein